LENLSDSAGNFLQSRSLTGLYTNVSFLKTI